MSNSMMKEYYLSIHYNEAVENVFGCCFIWANIKEAKVFYNKKDAQRIIHIMHSYNTGTSAYIKEI